MISGQTQTFSILDIGQRYVALHRLLQSLSIQANKKGLFLGLPQKVELVSLLHHLELEEELYHIINERTKEV